MAQGMERFPLAYVPNVSVPDVPVSYASKGASDQDYTLVSFEPDQAATQPAPASMGAGDTLSALGRNVWDAVVYHTPAAVASAIEGDEPYKTWDWKDALIERARERSKAVSQPGDAQTKTIIPGMTKQDINSLGPSLGFSVAGAGAGLGAGIPAGVAGSVVGTPAVGTVAGYTAGMAASGKAAYNMATNQFVRDLHDAANEEAIKATGKPVSPEAFSARQAELSRVIRDYGLWEAVPEAAGNALGFGILTAPVKGAIGKLFGKNIATRFASKMGALYGGELSTETITQMGQHNAEVEAGMSKAPVRSFTSPADWGESLREVAAPTILQTTLMAGGFKAGQMAKDRLSGKKGDELPDNAIPAGDVGAGPGGGGGISGEYIPASPMAPNRGLADQTPTGTTYDQGRTELPPGQTLLPLPALPAPEDGGPNERQVATARGLLNHSPNASPELLQRLMRVDQGMATMLFNHWKANGQVTGNQATEIPAPGDQGQGADIAGSRVVGGFSDGAVSFTPGAAAEGTAPGGKSGMAMGATGPDAVTPLDVQAHAAATSPFNATPQPTEAQKQAGNYAKGHVKFQGMDIAIENPAGSVRSGKDEDGKAWENTLQHHYGYIKGTIGRDKDHLDVFIKPGAQSARTAYVVDQINPKTGKFDEHKIVLGADSEADARAIYHANYEQGWQGMGAITAMPIEQFKDWIKSGKTKKPVAYTEPKGVSHEKPVPKAKAPAAIDPSAPYGKVGVAPFSSQVVGLKDNNDGTLTVMRGEEPFYDFENGDPVTVPTGATAEQIRQAVTDAGALSTRDKWFGVAKVGTKPAETGTEPAKSGTEPTKLPEQDPAAGADFLASNRAEFRHEGFRIYPISIKGEPRWAVQSLDNSERENKGERQIGGDAIVDTPEQAKQQAESQVTERGQKAELQRQFAEQDAAEEAKKEANRGLSITQRRANAALDKPTNLPVNAGVGIGTRREAMESAVSQERAITAVDVRDTAAYKRDEDEQGRLHRAGYGAFFGNDSHPQKMRFNELSAKLKNRDNYQKKEYRLYSGRDTEGSFYEITKTEYDYAKSLMANGGNAKPVAAIAGKPVSDMPAEQLQKIASGESKTFGSAAVEKASAELARRDEADSPKATKEPWQYGELEYGDKYIDETVLPDLRNQLANAHGGKFQEYPSKAAAVRGLKERIDTLENHRDAKARKYYASLDNHYGAVRAALADGKPVPPVAYESYEDLKGDVSAGRIKGDGQEVARVEQPQHIEAGQAEPATAPVIAASIKESAKNTPMNIEQAREWLLKQIDAAMIDAKSAKEEDVWDRAEGKVDLKGRMDVKETIGYKVFDVPGDGKFRVLNLKESLQKFKKQVAASPGFKKNATRPMSLASGNGGKTSVRDLLDDGEYVLAADYGHLTGKPLLFGAVRKGEAHPIAYTDAEPVDIKGIEAQVGREWNVTGKSFSWRVIETTTGASVSSESTKEKAISKALAHVDEHGTDKLIAQIKETPKVSQAELERQFTDWGSEEEAKAQKKRDAVERADAEDRALWNLIWPLKDGENRSPNPWNDIDHMQVVILAKDAAKAGKADEFVSLIERRRGGTNNVLALAARKALAEAAPKAKVAKGVIQTGVASKILGDIYQRAAYNKWTWDRLKSYLTREMEEAGVAKSRMANALEKAMTEYARTANGRLGYPNSNLVFSAMRDYGLIAEDAPGATAYPFYSNNKLFNAEGTAELPKDWTGVARSDSGKRFFYLGQENGERSFNPLKAENYEDALKEADGLKNDNPVVPEGYREVARSYFGGTVEKPIYAPFAEGDRVRFIGGHAGNIQSFIGGPVTTGAIIKYDNGLTGRAEWRDVEAIKKPATEQEPKHFKSIDTLNAANNPLGEDDWIRFADGSEWQVKGRMNGWALVQGKTEHPTVKNIMGQVPLIRAVIEANDAAQTTTGADDTTLTVKYGGSDLDIDLGKPAYQATMDDVEAAVRARGYSADANPRTKYDPMQMWRNAHATAVSVAAKDGKSIPARVLYDYRRLIRDDLNDEQADLAADKMVEVFRDTKDYEKAVQAYRDFGRSSKTAPPASIAGKPVSEMSDGMLNQIAKSSQPAAVKAKAEVAKRKKPKADPLAAVREFYTPGNIIHVDYWNQYDKVLEFKEGDLPGQWNVKVQQVKKDGDQWVPKDDRMEPPRWHATAPGKDKIVDRVPTQPPSPADAAREDAQDQARRENPDIKTTLAEHDATVDRLRDGTATLAEYKAAFQRLQNSTEELTAEFAAMKKDDILKHMGGIAASRYKSDTKAQVVTMAVSDLMDDFSIGRGISYTMGGRDAYTNAVRAQVERTTDADLAEYAEHVKAMRAAQTERVAQMTSAMKDPKTLADFKTYVDIKAGGTMTREQARMTLTPAQRVAFDELAAEQSREERKARGDQQRADIRIAATTTDGQVIETKHTKTGEPLFVVKAAERVERDVYNHWNATAKKLGGWYSSYRAAGAVPGFQFKTRENADAFLAFIGGNVEQAKEAVQTRRDAFEDDRSQTAVERLTEMADRLEERADESLNRDRKENTDRRARMAASAEAAANSDKSLAKTMRNIAQAIESGKTKFLDRVRQKAQVEMLRGFLHTAKANELRAKFPSYADQEKHRGAAPTAETADYVDFPRYTAFRSDLATMGRQMLDIDGAKKVGAALLKVADDVSAAYLAFAKEHLHQVSTFKTSAGKGAIFASRDDAETAIKRSGFKGKAVVLPFKRGQNIIIMSPSAAKEAGIWQGDDDKRITLTPDFGEEVVAKVKEFSSHRISMPYLFESVRAERARLKSIGIETAAELRAALREFMDLRAAPPEVDKVKQMERAMIGRKNDGLDFFPTPASVADELVQAAGIEEGMAVLEPSAGMGHIAERIRAAGVDPDVVEMASDRRELLEAKGFRLVGSDFMDMTPRDFTYGDVFRAPDGTLGVMRGSGGLGSNRVGLDPLDANGNPEPRRMGWYDRDELTGVKKRAGNSGYDRIIMNPPFSDRRDAEHVQHAYTLLKPGGRLVAIMGEGVFFGQDKKAQAFRNWLEEVGGTSEKLEEGTFLDPSLPVNTGVNARMVVIEKGDGGVIADPSEAAPGQLTSPRLGTKFANAREAVEWLAQNMDGEGYQQIARKILPFLRGVPIHYVRVGDTVPALVANLLFRGSAAVAYQADDVADGHDAIYVLEGKGDTEEGLLHEALHIATSRRLLDATAAAEFSDMAKAIRSSLYDAGAKSTDEKFKKTVEFFRREFRSPGELVAYGFSSPAFQDLLKLMAADGKFYTDYRTPAELAKVNKNASFQPQKRIPTPAYSMWHRLVDAVRALFGGPKAYQEAYERAIAANAAIDRNNELASRVEFKTLEEKLNSLLDALLQRPELSLSKGGAAQPIRDSGLESRSRSTGFASTESTRAVQSIVDKFLKQFADAAALEATIARVIAGSPSHFSRDTVVTAPLFSDLPAPILAKAKKEGYDANGRKPNGEKLTGATYDGKVYLVQENISSELEAEETLLHERIHQIVHGNAKDPDGIALRQSLGKLYTRAGAKSGIERMAKEAGIDMTGPLAAFEKVAAVNRHAFLAEEFLAHAEGQRAYEKLPAKIKRAIREFYGEFRDWLRGSRFVRIAEALGARLGDFTQADLAWTLKGIRQQEAGTGSKAIRFMTAWHGSPHDHDGFDSSKIGTGEGAQDYGWGHYFASVREVAEGYRIALTSNAAKKQFDVAAALAAAKWFKSGMVVDGTTYYSRMDLQDDIAKQNLSSMHMPDDVRQVFADKLSERNGRLYKVELAPTEDELLDWDKPLSEQSEKVKAALGKVIERLRGMDEGSHQWKMSYRMVASPEMIEGRQAYKLLAALNDDKDSIDPNGDKAASEYLLSLGIRGIKYLDGSSRNRPLKEIKAEFLAELPEDADTAEVMELVGTGRFSPKNEALIKALADDDWLGFDYPAQAISAALGNSLSNYDASPALLQAVSDAKDGGTHNYVIFSDADVKITAKESRGTAQGGAASPSVKAIQDVVSRFKSEFKGAAALDIRVVGSASEIPARYRPSPYAEGVFHDDAGLIYLVAGNLRTDDGRVNTSRAFQVLMHEAVGHYGLAAMMGERFSRITARVKEAARAKGEVNDDIYQPGHPDYATVEAVRLRYPDATENEIAQEVLARMAETDPGRTLFGYVRAVVRQWLRDMARAAGVTLDVTTAELNDLVALASRYMRRGDGVTQGVDVNALGTADMAVGGAASKAADAVRDGDVYAHPSGNAVTVTQVLPGGNAEVRIQNRKRILLGRWKTADLKTLQKIGRAEFKDGAYTTPDLLITAASKGMESRAAPTNPQGPVWIGPESSRADDLIYMMQDKNVDLKRVQQGITKALGDIRDDVDAYLQEELFHGRAAKATEEFLERELQPFVGEMKQRGIDMDTLETFLWARHAKERNAQIAKINPDMPDGGSGLTDKQAADILAGRDVTTGGQTVRGVPQAKLRSLKDLAAKVDRMVAGNRILTETYELETPDTVAAWKGAYQHYVPLHREDADSPWAGTGTGQGYSVKGSSTKRATGSFRPVENILANLVLQRTRTITRGEKNRVAQALYGLAKESPNEGFWDTDNAPTIRTVENKAIYHVMDGKTEVANFTRMADAEKKARENPAWFMYQDWGDRVVEKIDPAFRSKPNVVWARFGGEDRFVIFNERDERAMRLAGSLKNLDADDISHLLGEVSRWTRYFASINTQYNPVFGVINLIRDAGTGLLNLKSTPLEGKQKEMLGNVWQALPAIYKAVRIDRQGGTPTGAWADLWEDFQEAGGKTGYRDMFKNSHEQHEALQMALDPTWWQSKWWGKALTVGGVLSVPEQLLADKIGKPVFEWLSDYNTAMENGIRLSAYKLALDEGMTKQRAASLAKNLTVNFNKKGQVARQAGALYAFFNASVQGTARMAETLHHGAKPGELLGSAGKQIVYGGMLLGAMQAMLLMMAGFDDDEPPEFVRDRNIIIPAGSGKYLTVPLPLGFHVLPAIGRIGTEFVLGGFKKPGKHVAHVFDVLADSFNPIGNAGLSMQTLAPTVLDPAAALAENKDWTGKPIFRENMSGIDQKPGHARTKDTATGLSKGLAYLINAASGGTEFKPGMLSPTPDQIDYLIGQITGGVGRETSKAFQTGSAVFTGEDLPTYKIPLVGRFFGDTKGQSAVSGRFYENLKEMNEHQAEFIGLSKSNRSKEAQEYAKENPEAMMFREGDRLQRYVSKLRDQKRMTIAKGEPPEKIKAIDDQITKTMRDFNQRVDAKKNPQRGMARVEN